MSRQVYINNLVWRSLGQVTSHNPQPLVYTAGMVRVVWASWIHLNNCKYTKTLIALISQAYTERCWNTHTFDEQNWYPLQSGKPKVNAEFIETCPLAAILSFQTGMDATLLNYMCLGVRGLLLSLQWCSSAGCNNQSLSSGIPVWGSFN